MGYEKVNVSWAGNELLQNKILLDGVEVESGNIIYLRPEASTKDDCQTHRQVFPLHW